MKIDKAIKKKQKQDSHNLRMASLAPMSALLKRFKIDGLTWSPTPRKFLSKVAPHLGYPPVSQTILRDHRAVYKMLCDLADRYAPDWQPNSFGPKVERPDCGSLPRPVGAAKPSEAYRKLRLYLKTPTGFAKWRQVRYEALRTSPCCVLCGRGRQQGVTLHVDHIKPKSLHPELAFELSNLQVLCEDCNLGKGNLDETDFR